MTNDWKDRLGIVYSTNPDFQYDTGRDEEPETLPPHQQKLIVSLDKRNRKGKSVTQVTGFTGSKADLDRLGKILKSACGVGGSVKDGIILVQGEFREKVVNILEKEGYRVKRSGG